MEQVVGIAEQPLSLKHLRDGLERVLERRDGFAVRLMQRGEYEGLESEADRGGVDLRRVDSRR